MKFSASMKSIFIFSIFAMAALIAFFYCSAFSTPLSYVLFTLISFLGMIASKHVFKKYATIEEKKSALEDSAHNHY